MVTIFRSHPADRDWRVDEYGLSNLSNLAHTDADANAAFTAHAMLKAGTLEQIEYLSNARVRSYDGTTQIGMIDDRAWTLLEGYWQGLKVLALAYPEYFTLNQE